MGTWRWFSAAYCASPRAACVLVDAYLQLFLCVCAALFFIASLVLCWLRTRRRRPTSTRNLESTRVLWAQALAAHNSKRWFSCWRRRRGAHGKTTPLPGELAVIQKDADEAHVTAHKNSTQHAFEFMQQMQRISRVDFATAPAQEPRRPSRSQSLLKTLSGSFSIRRGSRNSPSDTPPERGPTADEPMAASVRLRVRKRSHPEPMTLSSGSSRRGSLTSSVDGDKKTHDDQENDGTRRPSKVHSAPAKMQRRSTSFRKRLALLFKGKPLEPTAHGNAAPSGHPKSRERAATTFEVPNYKKRQKLAALSPEHRKKKERRGSVELRDKRRLSVGKEAHVLFQVSDGNEASVYEVKLAEITLVKRLAFGPLSEVYAAIWRDTKVGVKLLMPREGVVDRLEDAVKNFRREIWVMNALRHPNIVKLIGASLTPTCYVLVMEYMSNGSLYEYLRDEANFFPHTMVLNSALDIAEGMRHIHATRVLQRDLKSKNCLVSENLVVKVADFGLARFKAKTVAEQQQYTFVGTPFWAAPEVIRHEPYDEKADVYSYAIVLWELVERKDPYEGINAFQVPLQVANDGLRPADFSKSAPLGLEQLMKQCWDENPDQRPSFDDIAETLQKWLAPTSETESLEVDTKEALEKSGDLSVHVLRERHCANERELHRFASSHDAHAKVIPIVLSRGNTMVSKSPRRSSAIGMLPVMPPRPASDRSLSRISNNSAP